jgi:soluble lytic murein transglycosylase
MGRGRARPTWLLGAGTLLLLGATAPAPNASVGGAGDAVDAALLESPGPALRHALDAADAGETERAERLLRELARRYPVIADYADYHRMRLLAAGGRLEEALALGEGWSYPDSPLGAEVHAEVGQALADAGREAEARAAWELALASTRDGERRAELRLELARSYLRSQQFERAASQLVQIWTAHAGGDVDRTAEPMLVDLERALGRTLRTAERTRRRGDVYLAQRMNEEALAAYDRALALGTLSPAQTLRAREQRATALFRLRRYTEAADAFAALPPDADHRIEHARAVARAGDVTGAAEELVRIGEQTPGDAGQRARLLAALLWEGEGETERALALYRGLAGADASGGTGVAALWRLGWDAYRAGRYDEAMERLERLATLEPDPISALRARYWHARAAERAGREDAPEEFGAIAREYPLSYYGWRSAPRAAPGASETPRSDLSGGLARLSPVQLARPRILLEAGLPDDARRELDRLAPLVGGLGDRLALAELYADADDFNHSQRLVVDAYAEVLARGPGSGPVELWWHAWPVPYQDAVVDATGSADHLDPALLYAVMREESGYRADVRSVTGARGLLQLMPETAERLARQTALPAFDADDLFRPDVNIRLGAVYLEDLLRHFSGRTSAAVGSYNAGPQRVTQWLATAQADDDEWVEAIPFDETREYVKRVLRSVHAYRVLY